MKIRQSFEQALCIVLLIKGNEGPMKSHELSQRLNISDSYLKKITRQLVVSGLISSKASKLGGFVLNKDTKDISLYDIFLAIEGKEHFIESTQLIHKVFPEYRFEETETMIIDSLHIAEEDYLRKLKKINLQQIINEAKKTSNC